MNLGRRSDGFLNAVRQLEVAGGVEIDVAEAIQAIETEFPLEAELPLGFLAVCYLGLPFEVHTLDLVGNIVRHYKVGEPLPFPYATARQLALHPAYVAIEVYADRFVCIREDGSVTEVLQ